MERVMGKSRHEEVKKLTRVYKVKINESARICITIIYKP